MQNEQTPAAGPSLLPCPFCGSAHIVPLDYKMWCESCHAYGPPVMRGDKVAAWNTRRPHLPSPASSSSVVQGDAGGVERSPGQVAYEGWAQGLPGCEWSNQTATQKRAWEKAAQAVAALRPQPSGETLQSLAQAFEDAMEGSHGAWAVSGDEGQAGGETREAVTRVEEFVGAIRGLIRQEGRTLDPADLRTILALLRPAAPDGGGEAWAWLAAHPSMELSHCYGDEDDDPAWQVHERSGNRSDREWKLVASGPTPLEAVRSAIPASEGGEG